MLEIGLDIIRYKSTYNVTRIGFLIDSSLSQRHLNAVDGVVGGELNNGTNIFALQLEIVRTLHHFFRGATKEIVQYDENGAW